MTKAESPGSHMTKDGKEVTWPRLGGHMTKDGRSHDQDLQGTEY